MPKIKITEPKKIEIIFTEEGRTMTSSSTMDKDLSVYSVVTALDSLVEGLKYKLGEYMHLISMNPKDKGFAEKIQSVTIKELEITK